jgi:hypothetical protein
MVRVLGSRLLLTWGVVAALALAGGTVARATGPLSWASALVDDHSPFSVVASAAEPTTTSQAASVQDSAMKARGCRWAC